METSEVVVESRKKPKKKKKMRFILLSLLLLAIAITFASTYEKDKEEEVKIERSGIIADGNLPTMSEDEIKEMLNKKQKDSEFTLQINSQATSVIGSLELDLLIGNSEINKVDCYVSVFNKGKLIAESIDIKPGQYLSKIELSKPLPKGKSNLIVQYHFMLNGKDVTLGTTEAEVTAVTI